MLAPSERKDFTNELVQINRNTCRRAGFEHRADAVDYFVHALRLTNNRLKDCSRFIHVRSCSSQPAQARIGTSQNCDPE
jgi:hypothetical protein